MGNMRYAYPVLGLGSGIDGSLRFGLSVKRSSSEDFILKVEEWALDNAEFEALIEEGVFKVVLQLTCPSTFHTEFHLIDPESEIRLRESHYVNRCTAAVFVMTVQAFGYGLSSFTGHYQGEKFELDENVVVGLTSELGWFVPKAYQRRQGLDLFQFIRKPEDDGGGAMMDFSFDQDSIFIYFPGVEGVGNPMQLMNDHRPITLFRSILLPALMEAYHIIQSDSTEEHQEKFWFVFLKERMEVRGMGLQTPPHIVAQAVFAELDFESMFKELMKG